MEDKFIAIYHCCLNHNNTKSIHSLLFAIAVFTFIIINKIIIKIISKLAESGRVGNGSELEISATN